MRYNYNLFSKQYIGQAYQLGTMDCLQLFRFYAEEKGLKIPEEFEGISWDDYAQHWETNKEKTKEILIRFICSMGNEIPARLIRTGDIVIYHKKNLIHIGIYIGDKILSIFTNAGVKVVKRNRSTHFEKVIRLEE